jgi:outer membrane protein assembly factor BamB
LKPYIDDRWRDILAGQGFSPRTEDGTEVWRRPDSDALIEITHSDKGDPLWLFYANRALVETGDESDRLLYLVERLYAEDEAVEHEKESNADDNQWLRSIGISVGEVETAFQDGRGMLD